MNGLQGRIREFFGGFFECSQIADADDIFALGYVNSLFAMQLIAWIEKTFEVSIEDDDLNISNFNCVQSIAGFIARKKGSAPDVGRHVLERCAAEGVA